MSAISLLIGGLLGILIGYIGTKNSLRGPFKRGEKTYYVVAEEDYLKKVAEIKTVTLSGQDFCGCQGLYFARMGNSDVGVVFTSDRNPPLPNSKNVLLSVQLDPAQWAIIVASLTMGGITGVKFHRIMDLHGPEYHQPPVKEQCCEGH